MFWKKRNDNLAAIVNRLDSLAGAQGAANDDLADQISQKLVGPLSAKAEIEIGEQFELASPFVAQRVTDKLESVIAEKLNAAIGGIKLQNTQNLATIISGVYNTHNTGLKKLDDIERRLACTEGYLLNYGDKLAMLHGKSVDIQGEALEHYNYLFQGQEEIARQAAIHDAANGDRMITLFNAFRELKSVVEHRHMLTQAKLNAMFNSLSAQLNDLRPKTREQYHTNPSLEWLMDNLDQIIDVANMAQAVRDNTAPRENTTYKLVRELRKLHLYSVTDVKDEVVSKIDAWDRAERICQAA